MRNIQLYATGTVTANAIAQVIIPTATRLKQVQVALVIDSVTDNANLAIELSKIPTSLIAVNGAVDPFVAIRVFGNFVTSGLSQTNGAWVIPLDVECRQGEIIYLHTFVAGTLTYVFNGIFHY